MSQLDDSFVSLKEIVTDATESMAAILSEEDTKLQIITRILTEPLGWMVKDISAERKHDNGYSDYVVTSSGRSAILLEAKRIGSLELPLANKGKCRALKLDGPALLKVKQGIDQAAAYASPYGIPVAVLTDGLTWIVFKPHVTGEHFRNKEAYVFPSLEALQTDFSTFYDLLSKESIQGKHYISLFDRVHNPRMLLSRPLVAAFAETEITRNTKSEILFDLDRVFDTFFSRMRGDQDPDLLIECFVETRESRIADFSLEKMTKQILGNIAPENQDVDEQLSLLIGQTVQQEEGTNVFIIGPTGSGKTTFLERFFRKTLSPQIRDKVVPIRLNCLDASGTLETIQSWMTNELIREVEKYSFSDGIPSWDDLLGLYFSEYKRRSKGVDAVLYENDREKYRVKFGEFMDEQVERDREGYLRRLLSDLVDNRKKLPLIVVDNTDEFQIEIKKAIFQFAQALRRHAKHCMVILPVTDKSAWSFSRTDIFRIYSTRSFFLPTPPPREVFRKRIEYIKKRVSDNRDDNTAGRYLSERGIHISITNLQKFAVELERQFVNHERAAKLLGELSNYNIRVTLDLARRVMTSSLFRIEQILAAHASGGRRPTTWTQFLNALLKGDHNMYRVGDVPEIVNVFQVNDQIRQSPLIHVSILALLQATANAAREVDGKHLAGSSIHDYFEAMGCTEASVDLALEWLIENRLLEKFDPSIPELARDQKLAITHSGRAHLKLALEEDVYFEQMALTTGVPAEAVVEQIRDEYRADIPVNERYRNIRNIFAQHLISSDQEEVSVPTQEDLYELQTNLRRELSRYVKADGETLGRDLRAPLDKVVATVDWFAGHLGYGFADCDQVDGQVFLHKDVLAASDIEVVMDGDDLICAVEFRERGPQIAKVHRIDTRKRDVIVRHCKVVRLFHDRQYGFVRPIGATSDSSDAFFHFSALEDDVRTSILEGDELEVEIKSDVRGRGLQVRKVMRMLPPRG